MIRYIRPDKNTTNGHYVKNALFKPAIFTLNNLNLKTALTKYIERWHDDL